MAISSCRFLFLWLAVVAAPRAAALPERSHGAGAPSSLAQLIFAPVTQPSPQQCHASTLVSTNDGSVIAAWFAGTAEKNPDVAIWLSRKDPGNGQWDLPKKIAKVAEVAHWNPVLFKLDMPDGTGGLQETVVLHFKVGRSIKSWQTHVMSSSDGFRSQWDGPRVLVSRDRSGGRGCVKDKPLILPNGTILAGASTEQGSWLSFVDRSDDGGRTWTAGETIVPEDRHPRPSLIQPTLWSSDGAGQHVHMFMRSKQQAIYRADSQDGGMTWGKAKRTRIPSSNSGLDAVRLPDGTLILVHNPTWGKGALTRFPLRISVSLDNGLTWPHYLDLEKDGPGEFSYPAIISWMDEGPGFRLTYTWRRESIAYLSMTMHSFFQICTHDPIGDVYASHT